MAKAMGVVIVALASVACSKSPSLNDAHPTVQHSDAEWDAMELGDARPDTLMPYNHTINIDGVDDFTIAERLATTTSSDTAATAWDQDYLFVGIHADDGSLQANYRILVIYTGVDGVGGTTAGIARGNQTPTLPFAAQHCISWNSDIGGLAAMSSNGGAWLPSSLDPSTVSLLSANYLELRVKRSDLGDPTTSLAFVLAVVNTATMNEETHAATHPSREPAPSARRIALGPCS